MKNVIKLVSLCIVICMVGCILVSCGASNDANAINVTVTVTAGGKDLYKAENVTVKVENPTVLDAFRQLMDDKDDFPMVVFDNEDEPTTVLDVGDFTDSASMFWEFRVNDKAFDEINGRASTYKIKDGDQIFWEYGAGASDVAEAGADDTAA